MSELTSSQLIKIILGIFLVLVVVAGLYLFFKNVQTGGGSLGSLIPTTTTTTTTTLDCGGSAGDAHTSWAAIVVFCC